MLKLIVVVFAVIVFVSAEYDSTNGQPGCKSEEELQIGVFRDNWDPTAYWKCEKLGEPGAGARCPDGTAFLGSRKECVAWAEWKWEAPEIPLSRPDDELDMNPNQPMPIA